MDPQDLNFIKARRWLVCLSGLSGEVSERSVERLFQIFGKTAIFRRVKDADLKPLDCGFLQFTRREEVLRVFQFFAGNSTFNIPSAVDKGREVVVTLHFDESIAQDANFADSGADAVGEEFARRLQVLRDEALETINNTRSPTAVEEVDTTATAANLYRGIPEDRLTAEEKDIVEKEIALFKLVEPVVSIKREFKSSGCHGDDRASSPLDVSVDDGFEAALERFKAKRQRYLDRIKQEQTGEQEQRRLEQKDAEFWMKYLQDFNDDVALQRVVEGTETELPVANYYKSPEKWWRRRKVDRIEELKGDEIAFEQYKEAIQSETPSQIASTGASKTTQLPVHSLIQKIASHSGVSKGDSFDWKVVTPKFVDETVAPFVTDLVVTYLSEKDDELIDFILSNLKKHSPQSVFVEELSAVFDDEAEEIVSKIWRILEQETSSS